VSSIDAEYQAKKHALIQLASFQCRNKSSTLSSSLGIDSLLLPVALAILETGIPLAAASVILSQIEPSFMPILRLEHDERYLAAKALHSDFYLLACYHLPMLVFHLDRHCPGWYWPRKRELIHNLAVVNDEEGGGNGIKEETVDAQSGEESSPKTKKRDMEQNGLIPLSWFVTNFAGECGASSLTHKTLLPLWDNILTKGDHAWKYFLAIAVFDKQSDVLLMSRGDELRIELERVLNFPQGSTINPNLDATDGYEISREWLSSAKSLMESTPSSVIELLRSADDRAVASALTVRQTKIDAKVQAQQEAEEQSREKERLEREKEAERALTKARLIAYYRATAPEKIDTVDQILKLFDGRIGVLNDKLKNKVRFSSSAVSLYIHGTILSLASFMSMATVR
jgi:predicted metal-dependent hydrolase